MRTSLDLPPDTFRKLKARAAAEGKTIKTLVHEIITEALRREPDATPVARVPGKQGSANSESR